MRLEIASGKAIKYACTNFHYSKKYPMHNLSYSVFNDKNEWCGVIMYGRGVNPHISRPYGLKQGQVLELQRVALNGKQKSTSKAVAISLKLLKKHVPLCKLVVSYADGNQSHFGTIYQASNWYFTGTIKSVDEYIDKATGNNIHSRRVNKTGTFNRTDLPIGKRFRHDEVERVKKDKPKYKYIYPIDKSLIPLCESLKKEYPKKQNAHEVNIDKRNDSIIEIGGANPTHAL